MDNYLFFAIMFKDKEILTNVINELKNNFETIISKSSEYDFNFTSHYEDEFGSNLKKIIIIFDNKINKKDLVEIKNKTADIEKNYSIDGKRKINIDPGYFNGKEVVLASFKRKRFKEDLGNNIFVHKVLEIENWNFKEFFHTFPDFKSKLVQDFFLTIIKQYL